MSNAAVKARGAGKNGVGKNGAGKNGAGKNGKNGNRGEGGPSLPRGALVGIGAAFALLFAVFVYATSGQPPRIEPASVGGPFQLTAQNGQPIGDKDLLGRPFLVFFGYTHCPDICHTTLFEISETLRALGPDAKIAALFVSVDPERDTPAVLKDYLASFDPRIIGLSGPRDALDMMLKEYRIYAKRAGAGEDYSVDHTTVVYLMDKNGRFVNAVNVSRRPAEAAKELQPYL